MSDINLLGSDVPAAASSDQHSADKAETAVPSSDNGTAPPRRRAGLSGMVMADLRKLAGQLGIPGIAGMRKNDLISAIKERQSNVRGQRSAATEPPASEGQLPIEGSATTTGAQPASAPEAQASAPAVEQQVAPATEPAPSEPLIPNQQDRDQQDRPQPDRDPQESAQQGHDQQETDIDGGDRSRNRRRRPTRSGEAPRSEGDQTLPGQGASQQSGSQQGAGQNGGQSQAGQNGPRDEDDEGGRRRGRRFRDRNRRGRNERGGDRRDGGEVEVREDDVLLPVAGILDVLDNYAFVRTSGYLSGPNDVYVSLSLVRKHGLRRGDAITGAVRQPREGEQQRQKFNPLVRVDTINGLDVEQAKQRPEFTKLTPLYPNERLRLETDQGLMTTRVIDLIMPIGKGQRALIVSPPKAGKTMILQALANAITKNNPECHLMVVLVDERPEEVTDMQRSVKGEVIASTFDRPPSDHTTISELAIERAKRLVEMGHDVVVLLDSITRLGRAYNLAAPASGRILSGGVDSTALYPPKRFLGAARNIEDGGSLTIFATALVETGSTMDTVIFEEFKGTGNAELKLDRKIADKRIFPAIDINPSGTRKEELLLSPDELAIHHKLRRVLSGLESQQAIDLVLDRLRKTRTNIEFLMQVSKSAAGNGAD
ncbi:MAG: transcription termination factor Rho [Actinomycetota bacterium]|nr:transcription termination factor Rho [Actinomycetota bacterium]